MTRKKKRQSEREAEIALRNQQAWGPRDEAEVNSSSKHVSSLHNPSENDARSVSELNSKSQSNNLDPKLVEGNKGQIDLNSDPGRDDNSQLGSTHMSMMSLIQVASLPLETYLKENGLTSLVSDQQAIPTSNAPLQIVNAGEPQDDSCSPSATKEGDTGDEENGENEKDP
ncbi:hypothetical protein HRI_003831600 [Hibiscus trionum]|uniref:Uncharacterized protein n=1 Tax=Hibiscus trionum TaxID=183268 RepID=A0A9W7IUQ1_HIBTR|nr:hypothetical protein HRI_003831600 [Hibiscus trionum]